MPIISLILFLVLIGLFHLAIRNGLAASLNSLEESCGGCVIGAFLIVLILSPIITLLMICFCGFGEEVMVEFGVLTGFTLFDFEILLLYAFLRRTSEKVVNAFIELIVSIPNLQNTPILFSVIIIALVIFCFVLMVEQPLLAGFFFPNLMVFAFMCTAAPSSDSSSKANDSEDAGQPEPDSEPENRDE